MRMKHVRPVTKAESTVTAGDIVSMLLSMLTAFEPIIEYVITNGKNQEV